jgi:hypothetical protein
MTQDSNPYSAPQIEAGDQEESDRPIPPLTIRLAKWTFVCFLSAIPSFLWALSLHSSEEQILAMAVGVFIFSLLYAILEGTHYVQILLKDSAIRGLAYFTYGCRLGCSVIFPIGMILDCVPGMYAVDLIETFYGAYSPQSSPFSQVLLTTLLQGVFLNVILVGFMSIIYGIYAVARFSIRMRYPQYEPSDWKFKEPTSQVVLEAELVDESDDEVVIAQ